MNDYRFTLLVQSIISLAVLTTVVLLELRGNRIDTTTGTILGTVLGGSVVHAAQAIGRANGTVENGEKRQP